MYNKLLAVAVLAVISFLCNIPLGRWRVSVKKFSFQWFLAVHLSIPLIFFIRSRMGLNALFIPVSLGAAVAGQLVGGAAGGNMEERDRGKAE